MADTQTITIKNVAKGPRGINTVAGLVMVDAGKTAEVEVSAADAKLPDYFKAADGEASEPGPLDQSVEDLEKHVAGIDDVDEIQTLIDAETAGKSRKGALAALEARRDELLA